MSTRQFTIAELAALGVPPDRPDDIEHDPDVLADERLATLKYTARRRCIFRAPDNGRTYAVEYEGALDVGDYEVGDGGPDNYGWYGDTVEAQEVEQRPVVILEWQPATPAPAPQHAHATLLDELATVAEDGGVDPDQAVQSAAEWLTEHADALAALFRPRQLLDAAAAVTQLQDQMDAEIRAEYGELDRDTVVEGAATRRMADMLQDLAGQAIPEQGAAHTTTAYLLEHRARDTEAWRRGTPDHGLHVLWQQRSRADQRLEEAQGRHPELDHRMITRTTVVTETPTPTVDQP